VRCVRLSGIQALVAIVAKDCRHSSGSRGNRRIHFLNTEREISLQYVSHILACLPTHSCLQSDVTDLLTDHNFSLCQSEKR